MLKYQQVFDKHLKKFTDKNREGLIMSQVIYNNDGYAYITDTIKILRMENLIKTEEPFAVSINSKSRVEPSVRTGALTELFDRGNAAATLEINDIKQFTEIVNALSKLKLRRDAQVPVVFDITENNQKMTLKTEGINVEIDLSVFCSMKKEDFKMDTKVGVDVKYLHECLNVFKDLKLPDVYKVYITVKKEIDPVIIHLVTNEVETLVAPIMLNKEEGELN
jgi:hypothetical protein